MKKHPQASTEISTNKQTGILTVSQFVARLKDVLKTGIGVVTVQGEVTGYRNTKGQLVYFELKDEHSRILCFALGWEVTVPLEDGLEVQVTGYPSVFQKSGGLHFRVIRIQPVGQGALQRALALLKAKLEQEGLFRIERKRVLPRWPETVGLITSPDAAAYTDVLRVLQNRWGGLRILFWPVAVQGDTAQREIIEGFEALNRRADVAAVILTRGGGSLEDLQAYNQESVARAIFSSRAPVVTGIGHERDWTIADLVADVRAATPSNAAELVAPDRRETEAAVEVLAESIDTTLRQFINQTTRTVDSDISSLITTLYSKLNMVRLALEQIGRIGRQLPMVIKQQTDQLHQTWRNLNIGWLGLIDNWRDRVNEQLRLLKGLSPQATLERGYSITRGEANGRPLKSAEQVTGGQAIHTQLARGKIISTVTKVKHAQEN